MGNNKKILILCIAFILVGTSIMAGMVRYFTIDEPVFINNYFQYNVYLYSNKYYEDENEDVELSEEEPLMYNLNEELSIEYITNKDDSREVSYVVFTNAPEIMAHIDSWVYDWFDDMGNGTNVDQYGVYSKHTLNLNIQGSYEVIPETIDLSKVQICFNNGDSMDVDLGEIILYCRNGEEDREIINYGNSYQQGDYEIRELTLGKSIIVEEINIASAENLYDEFNLSINGYDYKKVDGLAFSAGKDLVLRYSSIDWEKNMNVLDKYNIDSMIHYRDAEGNKYTDVIGTIYYDNRDYSFCRIYEYLKQRGKL